MKLSHVISLTMIVSLTPALTFAAEGDGFGWSQWFSSLVDRSGDEGTVVQTNVSVSADTGGNSASDGGTIITGEKTVEVHVRQEVNGEATEPIDIVVDENSQSYQTVKETSNSRTEINVNVSDDEVSASATSTVTAEPAAGDQLAAEPADATDEPAAEPATTNVFKKSYQSVKAFIVSIFENIFKLFS